MKDCNIDIIVAEDWKGIYFNGELFTNGHTLSTDSVIAVMLHLVEYDKVILNRHTIDQDYMEELGELPENLKEINKEKLQTHDEVSHWKD